MYKPVGTTVGVGLLTWSASGRAATFVPARALPVSSSTTLRPSSAPPQGSSKPAALGGLLPTAAASAVTLAAVAGRRRTARAAVAREAGKSAQRAEAVPRKAGAAVAAPFDPASQVGVTDPLGYWDPLGLAKNCDEEKFRKFRTAELKHGRVAMLATLGLVLQHFKTATGLENMPRGIQAAVTYPGTVGIAFWVLFCGWVEFNEWDKDREPGNFGDPADFMEAGRCPYNEQQRNYELNHGRLAMVGAIGTIIAEYATGKDGVDQWIFAKPALVESVTKTLYFAP